MHALCPKSLHISCAVSNFYGTEIEIRAGFGPVGSTEKNNLASNEQLLRVEFFVFFMGKLFFYKYCSVRAKGQEISE